MTGRVVAAVIGQVLAEWADTGYWPPCDAAQSGLSGSQSDEQAQTGTDPPPASVTPSYLRSAAKGRWGHD